MMVPNNQDRNKTAYTVTVDYRHGACSFLLSSQVGVTQCVVRRGFHFSLRIMPAGFYAFLVLSQIAFFIFYLFCPGILRPYWTGAFVRCELCALCALCSVGGGVSSNVHSLTHKCLLRNNDRHFRARPRTDGAEPGAHGRTGRGLFAAGAHGAAACAPRRGARTARTHGGGRGSVRAHGTGAGWSAL